MPQNSNVSTHERTPGGKEEWLTDPIIIDALGGWQSFDLDPCAPIVRPWPTAQHHYTIQDDGLSRPWFGRVWCNPPYGNKTRAWMGQMALHNNGIALIYARTETEYWFPWIWDYAAAVFFFKGRLQFYNVDGTPATDKTGKVQKAGAPSALIAYGEHNANTMRSCKLSGKFINLK